MRFFFENKHDITVSVSTPYDYLFVDNDVVFNRRKGMKKNFADNPP
jgi:hypothetical protein